LGQLVRPGRRQFLLMNKRPSCQWMRTMIGNTCRLSIFGFINSVLGF
jgi:hypothetical protein